MKFRVGQGGVIEVNSDVTLDEGVDQLVLVDATAGPVTVTLQRADGSGGKRFCIKKIDGSANVVTIDTQFSQTIDGAATHSISSQNEFVDLLSDNENWLIVGESMISAAIPHNFLSATHLDTVAATPPGTGSLAKGDGANLWAEFVIGAANAALLMNPVGTDLIYALIKNQNVDPTAAIAQSKLAAIALGDLPQLPALGVAPASPRQTDIVDLEIAVGAAIAQSKIAGLVAVLGTKVDTLADVGAGVGKITKAIVGTTAQFKSILAGAGITVNNLTDEIEIVAAAAAGIAILGNVFEDEGLDDEKFIPVVGSQSTFPQEPRRELIIPVALKLQKLAITIRNNARTTVSNFNLRVNSVTVNQTIPIPAGTTGTFQDSTNTDNISALDKIVYQIILGDVGVEALSLLSSSMESVSQ